MQNKSCYVYVKFKSLSIIIKFNEMTIYGIDWHISTHFVKLLTKK